MGATSPSNAINGGFPQGSVLSFTFLLLSLKVNVSLPHTEDGLKKCVEVISIGCMYLTQPIEAGKCVDDGWIDSIHVHFGRLCRTPRHICQHSMLADQTFALTDACLLTLAPDWPDSGGLASLSIGRVNTKSIISKI